VRSAPSYKKPLFPAFRSLPYTHSTIYDQSNFKVSTRIFRTLKMATITFIPYTPKPPKLPHSSIDNPPAKPLVGQPSSLGMTRWIDLGEASAKMLPAGNSSWQEMKAGDSEAAAHDTEGSRDDLDRAQGICSDLLASSRHFV
jgi:hypothetical protein